MAWPAERSPEFRAGWLEGMANAATMVDRYMAAAGVEFPIPCNDESKAHLVAIRDGIRNALAQIEAIEAFRE